MGVFVKSEFNISQRFLIIANVQRLILMNKANNRITLKYNQKQQQLIVGVDEKRNYSF